MDWKYVNKDGNPTEKGEYLVVLIYPEILNQEETGRVLAEIDTRYFGEKDHWAMCGQDDNDGYVWSEQAGSSWHEQVWAWMPLANSEGVILPEGVEWRV